MLGLTPDDEEDEYTYNECAKTRMELDDSDEGRIVVSLQQHGVFQDGPDTLRNIMNNDLVTPEIQDSLLCAELLGHEKIKVFVARRLCEPPGSDQHLNLKSAIHKNGAKTFSSLYEVMQPCKGKLTWHNQRQQKTFYRGA